MMALREFLSTPAGKKAGIAVVLVGLAIAGISLYSNASESSVPGSSLNQVFICAETGKSFNHKLSVGEKFPVLSPHSGKNTGYLPEHCYWTADGQTKKDPTLVLLNNYTGKSGPTICPDCKRLVVHQNPIPRKNSTPPPTEAELLGARSQR
jgi:hypothetical protein